MATSTTTMSMNKVIHCAVRRDLERFRRALEAFPDGDRTRAAGLHRAWVNFDAQLTDHHEGEHEIAFPALAAMGVDQGTLETFDTEHSAMAADLAATRSAMAQLEITARRADADTAAAAMTSLQTSTVAHLDHEEQVTEPVLARSERHPAMKEMARKFSRRSGPAKAGSFFAWMQDGATPAESAALRDNVPGPVMTVLAALFGRRYRTEIAPVWRH
jgi:hemerythrin-like domain-containing protein